MSATQELIAAALTAAGSIRWQYPELSDELRELCARAMVQPDVSEVERLINEFGVSCDSVAKRGHITSFKPLGQQITEHRASRTTLLDAVRAIVAERDALIADNERLSGLYEQAVKGRADMRSALRDARAADPQPVSAAEVPFPIPNKTLYGHDRTVSGHFYTAAKVRTYGDAREAAGYARAVAEADKLAHTLAMARFTFKKYADMHSAKGTDEGRYKAAANMRLVEICDAALRGEVK